MTKLNIIYLQNWSSRIEDSPIIKNIKWERGKSGKGTRIIQVRGQLNTNQLEEQCKCQPSHFPDGEKGWREPQPY